VISIDGAGNVLFDVIRQKKIEGIVAKVKSSKYVGRKSPNWLKIINYTYADVEIAGYRKDQIRQRGWQ
jgi:DNA ligase-1